MRPPPRLADWIRPARTTFGCELSRTAPPPGFRTRHRPRRSRNTASGGNDAVIGASATQICVRETAVQSLRQLRATRPRRALSADEKFRTVIELVADRCTAKNQERTLSLSER